MQANLETLRTRLDQVADLRDAQGLREGQRTLTTRIAEVEDCISAQNLREFMRRITRLEAQVGGNHGGVLGGYQSLSFATRWPKCSDARVSS